MKFEMEQDWKKILRRWKKIDKAYRFPMADIILLVEGKEDEIHWTVIDERHSEIHKIQETGGEGFNKAMELCERLSWRDVIVEAN